MNESKRLLDSTLIREFQERLLEARATLLRTVAITDDELTTLESHQPGALIEDAASEEVRRVLAGLEEREKRGLEEIYAAYRRLEAGTFGICEACDDAVPLARLRAMPAARLCVGCQGRQEGTPPQHR